MSDVTRYGATIQVAPLEPQTSSNSEEGCTIVELTQQLKRVEDNHAASIESQAAHLESEQKLGRELRDLQQQLAQKAAWIAELEAKVIRYFGPGDYSCEVCGLGMFEPCEHVKNIPEESQVTVRGESHNAAEYDKEAP